MSGSVVLIGNKILSKGHKIGEIYRFSVPHHLVQTGCTFLPQKSYWKWDALWDSYHSLSNEMITYSKHAWQRGDFPMKDGCISNVTWNATWLGISPARHSLSDRRINSSHGNNIFIFQGQRFSFFQSSCQKVENISWANTPLFGSGRKRGQMSTLEMKGWSLLEKKQ